MSKSKSLGLTIAFLAIAVFVSGSLVVTLRSAYGGSGQSGSPRPSSCCSGASKQPLGPMSVSRKNRDRLLSEA